MEGVEQNKRIGTPGIASVRGGQAKRKVRIKFSHPTTNDNGASNLFLPKGYPLRSKKSGNGLVKARYCQC